MQVLHPTASGSDSLLWSGAAAEAWAGKPLQHLLNLMPSALWSHLDTHHLKLAFWWPHCPASLTAPWSSCLPFPRGNLLGTAIADTVSLIVRFLLRSKEQVQHHLFLKDNAKPRSHGWMKSLASILPPYKCHHICCLLLEHICWSSSL